MHYIYYLLDPVAGSILYIGRGINPRQRQRAFERKYKVPCCMGICQKYSDLDSACEAELIAIEKHRPKFNKYLVSSRGKFGLLGNGHPQSEQSKIKISRAMIGRKKSIETRLAMSAAQKRRPPISEETRKKLSDSHKGHRPSPETLKKLSSIRMGHPVSAETRSKIGAKAKERYKRKLNEAAGYCDR